MPPEEEHSREPRLEGEEPRSEADSREGPSPESVEEIVSLARSGELEIPSGADDLAAALVAVANARDTHLERLQYTVADFHNFRRRAQNNEVEARRQGTTGVVQAILPIMDHFDLALGQDPGKVSVAQIQSGVEVIRNELVRALGGFGVVVVSPEPGEEFDPARHEAVMKQPAGEQNPGEIVRTLQAGYAMGERVIRPAKVSVAAGEEG